MKTPFFWTEKNIISTLLMPLGWLYGSATKLRFMFKKTRKADVPVICVGNLTAGGTGKTPVSLSIAQILQNMGNKPFFLTRGYGGKIKNIQVDASIHTAKQVGDEPLLLADAAPTIVNPDRYQGAVLAVKNGADCLIMDDGFQNPGLFKDLSFLVFDGISGIGNGLCVPAGPLRESFDAGLKRAQALIILGEDRHCLAQRVNLPIFYGRIKEIEPQYNNRGVLAFAGIGRPQKLYDSLQKCGLKVIETIDFPDHHQYQRHELEQLIKRAAEKKLDIYTTSKDFVKIPQDMQNHFNVLSIKIDWQDEDALRRFIKQYI